MAFKKPTGYATWSPQRQQQWQKNKQSYNQLNSRLNDAKAVSDRDRIEALRGKINEVKLRESQQIDIYRDKTTLSKAEENQLALQQQYMTLLGQANATQVNQFEEQRNYLQQQIASQQKQIDEQNTLYNRIIQQQEEATKIETLRAEREAGILSYQNSQANLFNVQQEQNAAQRRTVQRQQRTNPAFNRAIFQL